MKLLQSSLFKALLFAVFLLFFNLQNSSAQRSFGTLFKTEHVHDEQCGTVHATEMIREKFGLKNETEKFEEWMEEKIRKRKSDPAIQRKQQEVRVIPVVIHVIHTGTAVGTGANIPMQQIESQIRVLNEDFRRMNPDAIQTPVEFLPVAADAHVEFVLAKQDPLGRPTDGVVRVQGPLNSYDINAATSLWQTSQWPPDEYLNIWVLQFSNPNLLGFSVLPFMSLPGSGPADLFEGFNGVWMNFRWFGEGGNADNNSRGRTLTHEVGHFLGLHHTWAAGNANLTGCDLDDFVADTPLQFEANNYNCRLTAPKFSCDSRDMSENFMDYTPDACQNLFTQGQVDRIDVVLAESPFRASLVNSRAAFAPIRFENDLGIARVLEPLDLFCNLEFVPKVEVFNNGLNRINSARLSIINNGVVLETKDFDLDLGEFESEILSFDPISLPPTGNDFEIRIILVNNVVDPNPSNNQFSSSPVLQPEISLPYALNLDDIGIDWIIENPDDSLTWERTVLTLDGQSTEALVIRNFRYPTFENVRQRDILLSPRIDLSNTTNAQLTFMLAHAARSNDDSSDFLTIAVSTDCGNNFEILNANYAKDWRFLSTTELISGEFIPTSESQFRRELLNLSEYAGFSDVRIAIINENDNGNNIYIKDLEILEEEVYRYDARLDSLLMPLTVSTNTNTEEKVLLTNTGNLPLTGFIFRRQTNNGTAQFYDVRVMVPPGGTLELTMPKSTTDGLNKLDYAILFPSFDQNERDPIRLIQYVVHDFNRLTSPWRENFVNRTTLSPWISVNPENNNTAFTLVPVQSGTLSDNVVVLQNTLPDNSYWLASPLLDLSKSSQASIHFEMAAGQVDPNTVLKVLGSPDGGQTYTELWRKTGSEITTVNTPNVDRNSSASYRNEFVDLSQFAGGGNQNGRMALVVENGSVNNSPIYFDRFEFFLRADPNPVRPESGNAVLFPNPARDVFNIAFNLRSFEIVNIQIINANGAVVHDVDYPNTLNQTYTFSSRNFSRG
ncbi:M43 family zinc metalloprotease, partial [Aquiflexum sp.]|uniref:M43 family zinc metalloprotease n=1 Tax=Aquiflexum sp. TaxID=1872584 RepID=UPI0035930776